MNTQPALRTLIHGGETIQMGDGEIKRSGNDFFRRMGRGTNTTYVYLNITSTYRSLEVFECKEIKKFRIQNNPLIPVTLTHKPVQRLSCCLLSPQYHIPACGYLDPVSCINNILQRSTKQLP